MSNIIITANNTPTGSLYTSVTVPRSHVNLARSTDLKQTTTGLLLARTNISVGPVGKSAGIHTYKLEARRLNPDKASELNYFFSNYIGLYTYLDDYYELKRYAGIFTEWGVTERQKKDQWVTGALAYSGDAYIGVEGTAEYIIKPHADIYSTDLMRLKVIYYDFRAVFISETIEELT